MVPNKRVLVIDDEPGVLRFVKIALTAAGYDVVTTTSGEEGLKLVDIIKPDVMLLDIIMAPLTGFDVLARLRKCSRLPVIIFTARSDVGAQAVKEGANDFLAKPFMPQQLVAKIGDILKNCQTGS